MRLKYLLFSILFTIIPLVIYSQNGQPDPTFGDNGFLKTDISSGGHDLAHTIAEMTDGKLLAAGGMDNGLMELYPAVVQYNEDGSLSLPFGGDGIVSRDVGDDYGFYTHVGSQADGKVIAMGYIGPFASREVIVNRYLPNGDMDISFGNNGDLFPFNSTIESSAFVMLDDDSFLVANPVNNGGSTVIQLKKYLPNGSPDLSFGDNGTAPVENGNQSNAVYAMRVMPNGNIVIAGNIQIGGVYQKALARLLPDGSKDLSFGSNGTAPITEFTNYSLRSIAVFNDGRIAILQTSFVINPDALLTRITRYTANGDFDDSFGTSGQGFIDPGIQSFAAADLLIQPNQRLLLYGNYSDPLEGGGFTLVKKYHINGGTDTNFMFTSSSQEEYFSEKLLLQNDGKIVCLGTSAWYNGPEDFVLERYTNDALGVAEFELGSLSAFPNPTQNIVTLSYDYLTKAIPFQINDLTGKVLLEGELTESDTLIDLSGFQSGLYFLNTANTTIRLIKE